MKTKLLYGYPPTSLKAFASMNVLRSFASRASGDFSFISYGERCTMRLNSTQGLMGTIMNCRHWRACRRTRIGGLKRVWAGLRKRFDGTSTTNLERGITMENTVTYQNAPYTVAIKELWWQKQGLQQTATGYGRKLVTPYMLSIPGAARPYRVYAICFSNCASHYILRNGERLFLRDGELEEARDLAMAEVSA